MVVESVVICQMKIDMRIPGSRVKVHSNLFDAMKQVGIYLENIAKTVADVQPFEAVENGTETENKI